MNAISESTLIWPCFSTETFD